MLRSYANQSPPEDADSEKLIPDPLDDVPLSDQLLPQWYNKPTMKLFFDARYLRTDYHDGISRYSTELAHAVARLVPVTFLICDPAQRQLLPKNSHTLLIHRPTSALEPLTPFILNRRHPDVVFSPLQTMGSRGRRYKLILTLHDLIYHRHKTPPSHLSVAVRAGWRLYHTSFVPQRLTLNGADMVATVSETSKNEILSHNLTKRPVVVIPNAPQQLGQYLSEPPRHDHARNLVYMGSFMPYKNVETLIKAMEFLPDHTLHLLSRISPKRHAQLAAVAPEDAHIVFHKGVSDQEYAEILADNAVLVSASFDEGYGLPVAEALALGTPAVVTDMPIFHEVAGDGALYANPRKPRDFASKIQKLDDHDTYEQLSQAGKAHIATFSWDTSARELVTAAQLLSEARE